MPCEGLAAMPARDDRDHVLEDLAHAMGGLEVGWFTVSDASEVAGLTLSESNLRPRTGASIVAINRDRAVMSNPGPSERLAPGRVAVIGSRESRPAHSPQRKASTGSSAAARRAGMSAEARASTRSSIAAPANVRRSRAFTS